MDLDRRKGLAVEHEFGVFRDGLVIEAEAGPFGVGAGKEADEICQLARLRF